jgi:hypothetical protein
MRLHYVDLLFPLHFTEIANKRQMGLKASRILPAVNLRCIIGVSGVACEHKMAAAEKPNDQLGETLINSKCSNQCRASERNGQQGTKD